MTKRDKVMVRATRWVYFVAFSLVVFYPIFRCYFKIPYLFCHVCPGKCIFGFVRPYIVPAALIMNLEKRFWCYHACPIGTLFDCQGRVWRKSKRVPEPLRRVSIAVLVFTAIAYFKIMWDLEGQPAVEFDSIPSSSTTCLLSPRLSSRSRRHSSSWPTGCGAPSARRSAPWGRFRIWC